MKNILYTIILSFLFSSAYAALTHLTNDTNEIQESEQSFDFKPYIVEESSDFFEFNADLFSTDDRIYSELIKSSECDRDADSEYKESYIKSDKIFYFKVRVGIDNQIIGDHWTSSSSSINQSSVNLRSGDYIILRPKLSTYSSYSSNEYKEDILRLEYFNIERYALYKSHIYYKVRTTINRNILNTLSLGILGNGCNHNEIIGVFFKESDLGNVGSPTEDEIHLDYNTVNVRYRIDATWINDSDTNSEYGSCEGKILNAEDKLEYAICHTRVSGPNYTKASSDLSEIFHYMIINTNLDKETEIKISCHTQTPNTFCEKKEYSFFHDFREIKKLKLKEIGIEKKINFENLAIKEEENENENEENKKFWAEQERMYKHLAIEEREREIEEKRPMIDNLKKQCQDIGFKVNTEEFKNCVLELML